MALKLDSADLDAAKIMIEDIAEHFSKTPEGRRLLAELKRRDELMMKGDGDLNAPGGILA